MSIVIKDLFEAPEHVPTVARWKYDEFWAGKDRLSLEDLTGLLREARDPDAIPLSLLALCDGRPAGTVNLIEHDDGKRSHLRPWLAALFVAPEYRRFGVGSLLVSTLRERAARIGIQSMYLGTDKSGFYGRLGATIHERGGTDFCIMVLDRKSVV